jgi:hypothetical protein
MSNTARNAVALLKEQSLYYKNPIQAATLTSLKRRTAYLIKQSDNAGVSAKFIRTYRIDVVTYLGMASFNYLERCLDARDFTWRVSSDFNWEKLERLGMTRGYTRKAK